MSSPKNLDYHTLDMSLKCSLKNWVSRKQPPADGRSRLLQAAVQDSTPKISIMSGMVYLALNDNLSELYLERFKISPLYAMQPGSLGLSSSKGMA